MVGIQDGINNFKRLYGAGMPSCNRWAYIHDDAKIRGSVPEYWRPGDGRPSIPWEGGYGSLELALRQIYPDNPCGSATSNQKSVVKSTKKGKPLKLISPDTDPICGDMIALVRGNYKYWISASEYAALGKPPFTKVPLDDFNAISDGENPVTVNQVRITPKDTSPYCIVDDSSVDDSSGDGSDDSLLGGLEGLMGFGTTKRPTAKKTAKKQVVVKRAQQKKKVIVNKAQQRIAAAKKRIADAKKKSAQLQQAVKQKKLKAAAMEKAKVIQAQLEEEAYLAEEEAQQAEQDAEEQAQQVDEQAQEELDVIDEEEGQTDDTDEEENTDTEELI